jgi:hypothetical protein
MPVPAWANDTHSGLKRTFVSRSREPHNVDGVVRAVQRARDEGESLAIAGGRHAMGGQQFLTDGALLDMRQLNRVLAFDADQGLLEVEAGITWPDVIRGYLAGDEFARWGIRQKQTGADRLTIGGAVAANILGSCLTAAPFIADLEALKIVTPDGELVRCSRTERTEFIPSCCRWLWTVRRGDCRDPSLQSAAWTRRASLKATGIDTSMRCCPANYVACEPRHIMLRVRAYW